MKIYIAVDFEGGAAIVGKPGQTLTQSSQYQFAREQLTNETNAAIEGALEGGATQILVNDAHGGGLNLIYERLHPDARILIGAPRKRRFLGLDKSFSGVFLIGYHPMSGTENGVLAHTFSSATIQNEWLNGIKMGEIGFDAATAGHFGVPVVLVTSCKAGCKEAKDLLGEVETVATKEGLGRNCAITLQPQRACELIRKAAAKACRNIGKYKPFVLKPPIRRRTEYKLSSHADAAERSIKCKRIDGRTIERVGKTIFDVS